MNVPGAQHEFGAVVRNLSDAGCGRPVSTQADSTAVGHRLRLAVSGSGQPGTVREP